MTTATNLQDKVVLITGGARRIGATVATHLHSNGANLVIHYRSNQSKAQALADQLNANRQDSVKLVQADLLDLHGLQTMAAQAQAAFDGIDILINNASSFYPTPVGEISLAHFDDLIGTNLKAPLFLSQALAPILIEREGVIINMVDVHAERPMKNHPVYCAAKAGLAMLTKSLAKELGPSVRVNGVAPGAILWPEQELDEKTQQLILDRTFLKRVGSPDDIATTILFLISNANYITGQIIAVDGGRSQFI